MTIDFNAIPEEIVKNFKGGEGELHTKNFTNKENKIMLTTLKPGVSSGYHKHEEIGRAHV